MKIPPLDAKYCYDCHPIEVIDGDTFRAELSREIDIGFDIKIVAKTTQLIRLYGLNSQELHVKDKTTENYKKALEAKVRLHILLFDIDSSFGVNAKLKVYTFKDKYAGRYNGLVYGTNNDCLNELLLGIYPDLYTEYYGGKKE